MWTSPAIPVPVDVGDREDDHEAEIQKLPWASPALARSPGTLNSRRIPDAPAAFLDSRRALLCIRAQQVSASSLDFWRFEAVDMLRITSIRRSQSRP
jgi:hypothetical protein